GRVRAARGAARPAGRHVDAGRRGLGERHAGQRQAAHGERAGADPRGRPDPPRRLDRDHDQGGHAVTMTTVPPTGPPHGPSAGPPATQAPAPPAVRPPAPPPARRGVPGRIRVITGVTAAALALLFAAIAAGAATAGDGLRVIGRDSGPQVVATANLYFGLSEMDALVADVLVMETDQSLLRQEALTRYESQRAAANRALLEAFQLAGDDQAERRTIQSVLDGLGRYEQLVAR